MNQAPTKTVRDRNALPAMTFYLHLSCDNLFLKVGLMNQAPTIYSQWHLNNAYQWDYKLKFI